MSEAWRRPQPVGRRPAQLLLSVPGRRCPQSHRCQAQRRAVAGGRARRARPQVRDESQSDQSLQARHLPRPRCRQRSLSAHARAPHQLLAVPAGFLKEGPGRTPLRFSTFAVLGPGEHAPALWPCAASLPPAPQRQPARLSGAPPPQPPAAAGLPPCSSVAHSFYLSSLAESRAATLHADEGHRRIVKTMEASSPS